MKAHLQTTLWTLFGRNASQREIERRTGVSRHTIRVYKKRYLEDGANCPGVATDSGQTAPPWPPTPVAVSVSKCEPHREFIEAQSRLRRNAVSIYQDLVDDHGFTGAYNSVKRFVAKLRIREPEQFDRLSFLPGEEMQVDYGEGALTRVPGTNRYARPRLFVATLRYSHRCYRRVVWKSSQEEWAKLHEEAFRYFGGSCRYVVLDNLKEGVLKPDIYEPTLNPVYERMLKHYEVVADPARARDPNRKGSVENAIQHTQNTALKGRRFASIDEQNAHLAHWETTWAATRIHGSDRRQVQAMFEEERPHLQPLPLTGVEYFKEETRTVYTDGCIRIDHSSYAARPARIGSKVLVRLFRRRIEILNPDSKVLIRTHERAEQPGTVKLPDEERIFNPCRETQRILAQAAEIGESARRLCDLLFACEGRVGHRKLWGIVGLARKHPRVYIDKACASAMSEGIYSYKTVKALTERLVAEALERQAIQDAKENPLTQDSPLIRSASEYADLFDLAAMAEETRV